MRRAFLSLYIVIVITILGLGWGIDQLWALYSSKPTLNDTQRTALTLLTDHLSGLNADELNQELRRLNNRLDAGIKAYSLDEFSASRLQQKIAAGEPVPITETAGRQIIYHRLPGTERVIALEQATSTPRQDWTYSALIVFFYFILAAAIYFWLWPLSRDLRYLEQKTQTIGGDDEQSRITLGRSSHVSHLGDAFDAMAARIRELLQSRKEMTYAVSHEIRTPLARMKFALEMASESRDPQYIRNKLKSVRTDVNALDEFVNDLLAYASFDQSQPSLTIAAGNFIEFCHAIVHNIDNASRPVDIIIACEAASPRVSCDWSLMELVITNLISNGLRHAHREVRLVLESSSGESVVIVEDDGPGIPAKERDNVFQPFVRLQRQPGQDRGYGLGLAIVRRILQWHQGDIRVTEAASGGARFVLRWPTPG